VQKKCQDEFALNLGIFAGKPLRQFWLKGLVMWSRHIAERPDYIAEKSIVNISPEVHHFPVLSVCRRSTGQDRGNASVTAATDQTVALSGGLDIRHWTSFGQPIGGKNWTVTRVLIRKMIYADRKVDAAVRQIRNEIVRMTKSMDHK
jgi:hypothetical protein